MAVTFSLFFFRPEFGAVFLRGAVIVLLEGAGEMVSGAVAYSFADFLYAHIAGFQVALGAAGFELVQEGEKFMPAFLLMSVER